jgi:GTP-binding protein
MDASFIKSAVRSGQFPAPDRTEFAFAGRSNVGKSSLINKLLNSKKLAKTSSRPGKTRTINFFSVGKDLYFADLPGYGYAGVSFKLRRDWKILVENYLKGRSNLKAVVVIIDIRRKAGEADLELLGWLRAFNIESIVVLTKADKLSKNAVQKQIAMISKQFEDEALGRPILFSSKTGQGKENLWKKIGEIKES